MKKRRRTRSITAIAWLLLLALTLTWLGAMVCTTLVTAEALYDKLFDSFYNYTPAFSGERSGWDTADAQNQTMVANLQWFNNANYDRKFYFSDLWDKALLNDSLIPEQIAVTITDSQGNTVIESGDYLTFQYYTQAQWDAHEDEKNIGQRGYLPLSRDGTYDALYELAGGLDFFVDIRAFRITGTVKDGVVDPVQIDYISIYEFLQKTSTEQAYPFNEFNAPISLFEHLLSWKLLMEKEAPADTELSVIYAVNPWITVYNGEPLFYRGQHYNSVLDLLHQIEFSDNIYADGEYTLPQLIRFTQYPIQSAPDEAGNRQTLTVTYGYYAEPLKAAVCGLWTVYLATGLLMLIIYAWVLLWIRRRLTRPLQDTCDAIAHDWYPYESETKRIWREPQYLQASIARESKHRRAAQDKITQLETALGYAKTAEENRRQMTSNIAHELKTPLAIIHSYTEGLKEHIAEDKRDQYLDTILAEAERMDAMVMEILDLSRLEAGKVTLTRSEFSLSDLTQAVYDTFSALAQEKNLQVQLTLSPDSAVFADEGRIEQVIRNLLSNAIRYTPTGGTVHIRTESRRYVQHHSVVFRVENSGHNFTGEELEKLWETFYRADPSRSTKGTGLGLAICKNIISLHGGRCEARNTDLGVEFSFVL